jgi:hypothetical protein
MLFIFSTPLLIRHLWQFKTVAFLDWCLICSVLLTISVFFKFPLNYKNVENCLNTNIYSYFETPVGQSYFSLLRAIIILFSF